VREVDVCIFRSAASVLATALALAPLAAQAGQEALKAPNVIPISARLVTSGQPTADALAHLASQGFGAVIYLAPPTVSDAVREEADIVRHQGLEYVNIPIEFGAPTAADFQAFVDAMKRFGDRKVLVHCQVNMRASSMTFLYRVVVGHESPEQAYEAVAKVWSPSGAWRKLLVNELRKANVAFEPY
jgi:protein tyrosine phosphatase (PTP) superfamily phosphohydrolase (DUF442 family)